MSDDPVQKLINWVRDPCDPMTSELTDAAEEHYHTVLEALEFYADEKNWDLECEDQYVGFEDGIMFSDWGQRARAALEGKPLWMAKLLANEIKHNEELMADRDRLLLVLERIATDHDCDPREEAREVVEGKP